MDCLHERLINSSWYFCPACHWPSSCWHCQLCHLELTGHNSWKWPSVGKETRRGQQEDPTPQSHFLNAVNGMSWSLISFFISWTLKLYTRQQKHMNRQKKKEKSGFSTINTHFHWKFNETHWQPAVYSLYSGNYTLHKVIKKIPYIQFKLCSQFMYVHVWWYAAVHDWWKNNQVCLTASAQHTQSVQSCCITTRTHCSKALTKLCNVK